MKGGIPFVLKRNADRSRFYRLVLHLQKAFLELQNFQTAVALSRQSFQPQPHPQTPVSVLPNHFIGVQKKLREINR